MLENGEMGLLMEKVFFIMQTETIMKENLFKIKLTVTENIATKTVKLT